MTAWAFQEAAVGSGPGGESPHPTAVLPGFTCFVAGRFARYGLDEGGLKTYRLVLWALKESVDGWPMAIIILRHSGVNQSRYPWGARSLLRCTAGDPCDRWRVSFI